MIFRSLLFTITCLFMTFVFTACSSGGKSGPAGKRCSNKFEPVAVGLYKVDPNKPDLQPAEKEILRLEKDFKIAAYHDLDFSTLPPGTYLATQTFITYQVHLPGESLPDHKNGQLDRGSNFKVSGVERPARRQDDPKVVTDDNTVIEVNCVRNYGAMKETVSPFHFEMDTIRKVVVTKTSEDAEPKYFLETGSYIMTDDFVPETERYSAIKVDRVATDETNSKPSDFFKSGDATGANYTASLYEIKPAAKGLPPTYELHSQLNTGDYTAQSRVVFKRVEE